MLSVYTYIVGGLMGWWVGQFLYSLVPPTFKQHHPFGSAALVGGTIGLVVPLLFNALLHTLR